MRRINYKSDIPPLLLSLKVDEKQITVPDCDFIVRFYIEGYEGRHYDCSHIGGVWSNCEPSDDGTKLVCYINNQQLGIGELCAEFHYISPNRRYSDGSQKSVVVIDSAELGVELVDDNWDVITEAAIDVTLPFIYRTAYEIARDHGYTGTAEDFYSALASVVGIADAEKKRVTAEITRNANEQERIENEENRLNAENGRVNAEAQRVRNEAIRGDAESYRVEQEEDRKAKFKEITEFIATVRANEGNRESNELERQTNEDTRITEEAKRVAAEKKRAAEFEQQKLDLTGKIDRSGDEMGGDLIFTDNAGVSFRTSDGGAHTMFNDTDDVAKFTADNGDTFEFKKNETPNKNSSAVVVSENLYNALDMTLDSMGSALDGDAAYRAEAGDKIFNPDTGKIQRYNSTIGGFEDLCDPIEGKLYVNKLTDYIYRWNTKAKKMVFVGGVKAYTKEEADSRFAKLDDATQVLKVKELVAYNSINTNSMWIGDEGLLLGGDGNGHLTVEQDEVITDVTLNGKLATKADDVAYGVEWNNGQPTGEAQETTVKEATVNTTALTLILAQSYNALEQEVEKKADKTELDTINANVDQKVSKTDIVQNTGQSTTSVMSQKATSSAIKAETQERNKADEGLNAKLSELKRTISHIEEYGVEYFTTGQVATPHIQEPFLPLTDDMVTITVRGFINNTAQVAINIAEDYDKPIKRLTAKVIDIDDNNCYNYTFNKSDYPAATRLYVSKGDGSHDEFCNITVNKGIISSKELSDNIESVNTNVNTKLTEYKNSNDSRVSDLENADIVINEDISSLDSRVKELETKGEDLTPYGEGGLSNGSANELSAQFLTEEFDPSRNWYIEFVANIYNTRLNKIFAIDWGYNKNFAVIYLRILNGLQFTLDDTTYAKFRAPISLTNHEYAHYMLAKNETGISLFCNGILLQTVEYTATYSPSINKLHIALYTNNNFKLFRIGYYEVFDSLVAHYNNGNPFAFVEVKSNMIAEFLPENLTKTKATNTVNGISLEYEEGKYEPIVDNPWANPIKAEGSPVNVPMYAGQHYLDTTTNIMYEAIGNTKVTDWKKIGNPTFDDLDILKEEIIDIGDRRWTGGSGGGSTAVVVTDYYKDGITEDSDAIEAAIEAAKNFGKVLYFPKGTYKLRRSIQLWNNAVIDGDKGAVLTHKAVDGNGCIMTTLSSATVIGDTTISVSSVAGLSVGDEIVIYDTTSGLSSYQETMCKITAINGNTLTIDATQWHGSVGVRRAYPVTNTRITTDFALIHTPWVDGAHNCVIRNITLQANGNNNEPYVYSQSPIHIHSKNAYDISIKNIVVDGSVNDGISIQGSSKQSVIGCTVKGIKWKGVHWGTTSADVLVERCWFENCGLVASNGNAYNSGGGAIYSCYNNHKLRIVNNHITDCLRGVFGLDVQNSNSGEDGSWVVSGNVFDTPKNFTNRAGLGISVGGSNNGLITNNIFCRFGKNSTPITIDNSEDFGGNTFAVTISNNTFGHWQSNYVGDDNKGAIYVKGATKCIVNGNNIDNHYHDYGSTAAPTEISGNTNIIVDNCTKCVVTNNIVAGGKVEEKNTNTGCVIANNVVDIVE